MAFWRNFSWNDINPDHVDKKSWIPGISQKPRGLKSLDSKNSNSGNKNSAIWEYRILRIKILRAKNPESRKFRENSGNIIKMSRILGSSNLNLDPWIFEIWEIKCLGFFVISPSPIFKAFRDFFDLAQNGKFWPGIRDSDSLKNPEVCFISEF